MNIHSSGAQSEQVRISHALVVVTVMPGIKAHLHNPRDVVPESIMPSYPWLFENKVNASMTPKKMKAMQTLGVPYTDDEIANATSWWKENGK